MVCFLKILWEIVLFTQTLGPSTPMKCLIWLFVCRLSHQHSPTAVSSVLSTPKRRFVVWLEAGHWSWGRWFLEMLL
ncbi:hypothetical protein IHE45_03G083700 [Dioscorea alata]|nr:hypothetical protein IHE45_03G083700 [Dioscorea alata]